MDEKSDLLDQFRNTLRLLCEQLEELSITADAYEALALTKGASFNETVQAKDDALCDPQIRKAAREQYAAMWLALEQDGLAAFYSAQLADLPTPEKPN